MTTRPKPDHDAHDADPIRVLAIAELAMARDAIASAVDPVPWIAFGACRPDPDELARACDPPPAVVAVVARPEVPLAAPAVEQVLAHLSAIAPGVSIVAVAGIVDAPDVRAALALGVSGYVAAADGFDVLLDAIRHVADGASFVGPSIGVALARDAAIAARSGLDDREREVLRLAALGYTAAEAAGELGLSVRSIEAAKQRACERLGLGRRRELVAMALDLGLLHRPAA